MLKGCRDDAYHWASSSTAWRAHESKDDNDVATSDKGTETKLWKENHAEIVLIIKNAQDAQMALEAAIVVLKDFYKVPGMISKEPWEFLQTGSGRDVELPEKPSTWDSSYTGTSYPNVGGEGIFTILNETMQRFTGFGS